MATIADLMIRLGIQNEASAGLRTFEKDTDSAGAHTKTFASNVGEAKESIVGHLGKIVAAAGIAGAVFEGGEFLKGGIEAAEGLQKANESLDSAIEKTGGSVQKLGPIMDATAKGAADYGVSQRDATLAMAQATLMTGSAAAGQRAYEEAILLAKGAHLSLTTALRATAKGQDGVTSGLTRYGVVLKKGATGVQQLAAIQKVWGGQAQANTLDSDRLNAKFQNMQAALGTFLLPMFLKFTVYMGQAIDGLVGLAHWVGKNSDIIAPLAAAIGAVAVAIGVWQLATAAWTAVTELATSAQVALNVAMDANPIGLVVLALVGLAAALVVVWTRSETFRTTVLAAWNAIKNATLTVFNAIKDFLVAYWPYLLGAMAGPLGLIVAAIVTHWGQVKSVTEGVWNGIKSTVLGVMNAIRSTAETVWGAIVTTVSSVVKPLTKGVEAVVSVFHPVLDVLHTIESAAESAASAIAKVASGGGIGGKIGGVLSHIPGFATGVSNFGGGLAMVGENGPELVNLPGGADVFTNGQSRRMLGGSNGGLYVENMNVRSETDVRLVARELAMRLGG